MAQEGKDMGTGPSHMTMAPLDAPFSPEHAGIKMVAMRWKMVELWTFEQWFYIPTFMNFDELNCYYELFLSQISKYDITTHAQTWLRENKNHIMGLRINLSEGL